MDLSIFFAGTAGSIPTARRGLPAVLVRRGGDRILFDCGEGTQRQLVSSVGLTELTEVFLTHLHADHWLGLPGMLKTFDLRGRERPLTIHGPPPLSTLLPLALRAAGRVRFELDLVELAPGDVLERDDYRIAPVEVAHRVPALGYVLFEDARPGVFDPDAAAALGLEPGYRGERPRSGRPNLGNYPNRGPKRSFGMLPSWELCNYPIAVSGGSFGSITRWPSGAEFPSGPRPGQRTSAGSPRSANGISIVSKSRGNTVPAKIALASSRSRPIGCRVETWVSASIRTSASRAMVAAWAAVEWPVSAARSCSSSANVASWTSTSAW